MMNRKFFSLSALESLNASAFRDIIKKLFVSPLFSSHHCSVCGPFLMENEEKEEEEESRKVFVFVSVFINCHLDSNFQLREKWTVKNFFIE